jgi:hypothetical protein
MHHYEILVWVDCVDTPLRLAFRTLDGAYAAWDELSRHGREPTRGTWVELRDDFQGGVGYASSEQRAMQIRAYLPDMDS